jgi:hypothetical protein
MPGTYRLLAADGTIYESTTRGQLGGNRRLRIYGRLDCGSAIKALPQGYAKIRVFFADEDAAIAAGFRPCGNCMKARYQEWKRGPQPGVAYPWLVRPPVARDAPTAG